MPITAALLFAFQNICHWIITDTYIRVSFETRMLLKKETYMNAAAHLDEVTESRRKLTIANVCAGILIMAMSTCFYVGNRREDGYLLQMIAAYSELVFQMGCMVAWACTLVRLYKDINHSEKLLPKKRIFILHGSLLVAYLLVFALTQLLTYWFRHTNNE